MAHSRFAELVGYLYSDPDSVEVEASALILFFSIVLTFVLTMDIIYAAYRIAEVTLPAGYHSVSVEKVYRAVSSKIPKTMLLVVRSKSIEYLFPPTVIATIAPAMRVRRYVQTRPYSDVRLHLGPGGVVIVSLLLAVLTVSPVLVAVGFESLYYWVENSLNRAAWTIIMVQAILVLTAGLFSTLLTIVSKRVEAGITGSLLAHYFLIMLLGSKLHILVYAVALAALLLIGLEYLIERWRFTGNG